MADSSPNGWKTLWEKEKLLFRSNFSFSQIVLKRLVLQKRKKGLFLEKGYKSSLKKMVKLKVFVLEVCGKQVSFNPFPNKPCFLAPLAKGQRAIVIALCLSSSIRLFVHVCIRKLFFQITSPQKLFTELLPNFKVVFLK